MKPKDSFKEEGRSEDVVNLRYNYYVKRYNTTMKSLINERKKILKRSQYIGFRPKTGNVSSSSKAFHNRESGKLLSLKVLESILLY